MPRFWYSGKYSIQELSFYTCEIKTIEADAFNVAAFRNTTYLSFHDQYSRIIEYQPGFLNGLSAILTFMLDSVVFISTDAQFLRPIKQNLQVLELLNATTPKMVQHIFIDDEYVSLQQITIKRTNALPRLTQKTFGVLSSMVKLDLDGCGIAYIESGAFDSMPQTLNSISMRWNNLQTIPPDLFARFMATAVLALDNNPWKCQCILLKLNSKYNFLSPAFHRKCNWNRCRETEAELNLNLRTERSCIYHAGTTSLFTIHPKFMASLTDGFDSEQVRIDGRLWRNSSKVIIVILMLKSFVFENEFQSSCYIAERKHMPMIMSLDGLDDRTQPYVMHIMDTPWRVWPMNIFSIRPLQPAVAWIMVADRDFVLATVFGSYLATFLLGALSGFLLLCRYPILIKDLDRVVVLSNKNVGGIKRKTHVFIMPRSWKAKKPARQRSDVRRLVVLLIFNYNLFTKEHYNNYKLLEANLINLFFDFSVFDNAEPAVDHGYLEVFHTPLRWSVSFGETDSVDYCSINEEPDS